MRSLCLPSKWRIGVSSDNLFFHFSFQSLNVNTILRMGFYVFWNLCPLCWPIVSRNECVFLFIEFSEVIVLLLNGFSCIIPAVHLDTGYSILRPANCKYDWAFFSFRCKFVQSIVKTVSMGITYHCPFTLNMNTLMDFLFSKVTCSLSWLIKRSLAWKSFPQENVSICSEKRKMLHVNTEIKLELFWL